MTVTAKLNRLQQLAVSKSEVSNHIPNVKAPATEVSIGVRRSAAEQEQNGPGDR